MRGLYAQHLLPVIVTLGGLVTGALLETVMWGAILGGAFGILLAGWLASRTIRRLEWLERLARKTDTSDIDAVAMLDAHDQIDHALRTVAQQAVNENRLRQADSLLMTQQTQVLDRMHDGLMRVAEDGRVTYANVAASSLFGGRNPSGRTFMSVTRDHELNRAMRLCLEIGEERQHTFEVAGESRLMNAVVIRISARPAEALVMLRDITEVNRLQNLRRDFVSNVSHELRTPLSTIKILTETLLDIREDDQEAGGFLRKIDGEVDSMTALVRDLLDLTRLETMGGRLALREIEAGMLVRDVCDRMRPLAQRHDVTLSTPSDDAGAIVGDVRRLHQALINLITNAIVHTPAGGSVVVGARRATEGVTFFVRDTGTGIPPEDLPRIWERFFKTDKARSGPGTGLGLAIVKHIVQAHAGSVSAVSEIGEGSEFSFVIPANLGPVAKLPPLYETSVAPN